MEAQLTIRVPGDVARKLQETAERLGIKKSDVARTAISQYLSEETELSKPRPFEHIKHLIGSVSSGLPDLGERHRDYLLERLKKHA